MIKNIAGWLKTHYQQVLGINDSPHRTALGLGLGVFLGNFPSMGPLTALVAAFLFRANRAAALIGSLLTNTWMSLLTLGISVRIGSFIRGNDDLAVEAQWNQFINNFNWHHFIDGLNWSNWWMRWRNLWRCLKHGPVLKILASVFVGYFIVSLIIGVAVYFVALFILNKRKKSHRGHHSVRSN